MLTKGFQNIFCVKFQKWVDKSSVSRLITIEICCNVCHQFAMNKKGDTFYALSKVLLLHTTVASFQKDSVHHYFLNDHFHSAHLDLENVEFIRSDISSYNSAFQERSVLPKYPRVSPVIRSSPTSSGSTLDCSSNATLVTNTSPFNSQTALITEKRYFSSDAGKKSNHYYAENLRNNHQKTLNKSRIYDPLNKAQDVDYKQLDPLLPSEQSSSINILMDSQDVKLPKDSQEAVRLPPLEFQKESKPSWIRFAAQVSFRIFFFHGYVGSVLILNFSSNLKSIVFKCKWTERSFALSIN